MKNPVAPIDWLTRLAHDLRSPITPMRFAVQLLQSDRLPPGRAPELLDTMDRQIDLLLQLADELTDMIKIGSDQYSLQLHEYDLAPILEDAVRRSARAACRLGKIGGPMPIRAPAHPVRVVADEVRLAQLIAHLLGILGMPEADNSRLCIEYEQHADRALVRLCDSERGIWRDARIDYLVTGNPPLDPGVLGMSQVIYREIASRHDASITLGQETEDRIGVLQLSLPLAPT